ncbi:S24 family peptidase [uncultured Capnocytophaga sp.]|uniref:S24 family peptidase n=1 Tax=uncultured Capnocytophaga sp. TaxID=159273 RepID=UPI0028EB69B3|nr:S24 family peptidase [uncultured Capnocytophaga sp.]
MKNNSDTEQNSVKNRLIDFLKYKEISQSKFEQLCGISNGYVNNIRKGIKSEMFDKKIAPIFPELSKTWLLLGEGSMLIPQIEEVVPEEEEEEDDLVLFLRDERKGYDITLTDIYEKTRIPVKTLKEAQNGISELSKKQRNILSKYIEEVREYFQNESIGAPKGTPTGYYYPEIYAKAGFDIANFNNEMQRLPVYIPNFSKDVIFINVYGDSMYPKYKAGDVIGIKPVDFLYLVFGHPYVVVFDNGDVNIKYVRRGSDDEHVSLESENPKYDPREYPLKIIRAFYAVEGSVKKERM